MSFEEFEAFQKEIEQAQKEQEEQSELNKKLEEPDDWGFSEVLKERQKHKDSLKKRLENLKFNEKEIQRLFKIISKAEFEMEKVKQGYDYKSKIPGSGVKLRDSLVAIQNKMKEDFDKEFQRIIIEKKSKK